MIDHIGITCAEYAKSREFYDAALGALGFSRQMDVGRAIGYGRDGKPSFWISDGAGMGPNREVHLAFGAADENAVRAFHDAALALGAESSPASGRCPQHAPRLWPEYHPGISGRSCAIPTAITSKRCGTGPVGSLVWPTPPAPTRLRRNCFATRSPG